MAIALALSRDRDGTLRAGRLSLSLGSLSLSSPLTLSSFYALKSSKQESNCIPPRFLWT